MKEIAHFVLSQDTYAPVNYNLKSAVDSITTQKGVD